MAASTWHWDLEPEDLAYEVSTKEVDGIIVYFRTNPMKKDYCQVWAVDTDYLSRDPTSFGAAIARQMKEMGFQTCGHDAYYTHTAKADWTHTTDFTKEVNSALIAAFENQSVKELNQKKCR